jgi:hypothetical protein
VRSAPARCSSMTHPTAPVTAASTYHHRGPLPVSPSFFPCPKRVLYPMVNILDHSPPDSSAGLFESIGRHRQPLRSSYSPVWGKWATSPGVASLLAGPGRSHQPIVACWHSALFLLTSDLYLNLFKKVLNLLKFVSIQISSIKR